MEALAEILGVALDNIALPPPAAVDQNDFQLTAQRLLEYCDLPWEDACLDFHSNAAPTGTASAVQVRQPVYSSSVDKWRIYASQLRPLTEVFEANGIQTGSIEAHQEQAPN